MEIIIVREGKKKDCDLEHHKKDGKRVEKVHPFY